ncbi:MAG: hypothetical protein NZ651_05780 [Candidatus Bipolaricaulota bacterium]|nr:hypothetical protein [Candidatus Bipolaricaulota bacterium]MDW8127264.1 hypothetical protein [Candidatus Bipolaricaulota bacterium]
MSANLKQILIPWLLEQGGEVREKGEEVLFEKVLATRTVFFARRKAVLRVRLRPKETKKELEVTIELVEKGFGLPSDTGIGGMVEVFKTTRKRLGRITERFALLSQRYQFSFDYTAFSRGLEECAKSAGYTVRYVM